MSDPQSAPTYRRRVHRGMPKARVWFRGRWRWLPGRYDSPESRAAFEEIVREWERDRQTPDAHGLTVARFVLDYIAHVETRYVKNGQPQ